MTDGSRNGTGTSGDEDRVARSELLSRLRHEVASPLGVLSGALQELREYAPQSPEVTRYFRLAERAMERLVRLSHELDEAADLEGAPEQFPVLEPEEVDLRQVVQTGIRAVAALEPRVFELVESRMPAAEVRASVDIARMTRTVDLLLAATLRFARSRIVLALEESREQLEIRIEDDGAPIPEEFRVRLFDRFRARFPLGRDRGVVFGMSIARDYVAAHGGRILVEEAPPWRDDEQGGIRLRVLLPRFGAQ